MIEGRVEFFFVGMICVIFALSFGVLYGASDQNLYLLPGHQLADPTILKNDWFVSQTVHPHTAFNYLIFVLVFLGYVIWTTTMLHLLCMTLLAVSVYWILSTLYEKPFLPFLVSMLLLHIVIGSEKLLSHAFFVPWLLPTNIAGTCFLTGIAVLGMVQAEHLSRYVISGVFFGLSALFHGTYLFLIPPFLIGLLLLSRNQFSFQHILAFLIPFLVITFPVGWNVLLQFALSGIEKNSIVQLDALARLRIPHHYLPETWDRDIFFTFLGHISLGITGLFLVWPSQKRSAIILAAIASMGVLSILILFCTMAIFVPYIALLQGYRFVSFLSIFSLLLFAGAFAREVEQIAEHSVYKIERISLIALGLFIVYKLNPSIGIMLSCLFIICLILSWIKLLIHRFRYTMVIVFFIGTCLFLGHKAFLHFPMQSTLYRPIPSSESSLYRWVQDHTEQNAIFVIPVELQRFRLQAQRSIVVDWKGYPFRIEDIREWFRRMSVVCDVKDGKSFQEFLIGYAKLDVNRAFFLSREFGAHYVVVREYHQGNLGDLKKIYSQNGYAIYQIEKSS